MSGASSLIAIFDQSNAASIACLRKVPYYRNVIYNITTAQKYFEKLVTRALAGEEVILARRNDPVAELVPVAPRKRPQKERRRKAK